jgi:hypothetical protein
MKYYRMSYDEVVNVRSFRVLMLLNLSIETEGKELGRKARKEVHANDFFSKFI